ncbi:integrase catalytic domain-containing protein [Trichonephila clavipes]|nr:integrase catalytic domain-containing protein [Trichonephila clavipes]
MPHTRQSDPLLTQTAFEKVNLIDLIPMYDGGESLGIRRFLGKINDVANLCKWSNDEKVTYLKLKLTGIAEEFFLSDPTHSQLTEYNDIARILIGRFEKAVPLSTRLQLFSSCIQGPSESVQEFAARINKLGTQIFQSGNSAQNTAVRNANDQLLQSRFISGLRNDIRRFVLSRDPLNLEESINAALIEEQNMKLNQTASEERSGLSSAQTENPVLSALADRLQEINLRVGRLQEASAVTARKSGGNYFNRRENVFKCFYCGIQGHRQAACRKRQRDERAARYQPPRRNAASEYSFSSSPRPGGRHVHFRESTLRDNYAAPRHSHGRDIRLSYTYEKNSDTPQNKYEYVEKLLPSLKHTFNQVLNNLKDQEASHVELSTRATKQHHYDYKIGSLCFIKTPNIKSNLSPKLRPKFEGPYRVIERFSNVNYRVQHVEQLRKRFNTHVNRMIPFIKRFSYLHLKNLDYLQPDETEVKGIVPSPRYNLRARAGKWSNDEKVTILKLKLTGIAEEFFLSDPTHSQLTEYNDIARILIGRFEKAVPLSTRLQLFSSCIQGPSESVQEFAARINKLGTQIFQSGNSAQNTAVRNANDQLLQSRFISGLRNDIRRFVLSRDPLNLEESINAALIEEQNMKLNQIASEERSGLSSAQTENPVLSALADRLQEINLRVGRLQEASAVTARKSGGNYFNRRENVFKCFYCGIQGHRQAECRKRQRDERAARYQPPPGEMPQASILFQVAPGQEGGMYISGNLLSATITQPPGIQ